MADPGHPLLPLAPDPVTGVIQTVQQDSVTEIRQCAKAILRTRRGQRIEDPDLGITDPRFRTRIDTDDIDRALTRSEPRAAWSTTADPVTGKPTAVRITQAQ